MEQHHLFGNRSSKTEYQTAGELYFAQARRYDAGVGRFVSEDFIKGHIAVPYTMNHYNYCWNRPMDLVDLNGMWPSLKDIGAGISAVGTVTEQVAEGGWDNINVDKIIISAATGSVSGALMGSNAGKVISIVGNGIISASGSVASDMVDYNGGEDISSKKILKNAVKNGLIGGVAGFIGGEGAQYGSYKATTVTSILFDGNQILGSSGTVKQCFYGSYKNMLNSNFKIGTCKTIITTGGITIKNIFAHANEEECPQKRGDKEWRTGALLLS